MSKMQLTEDQWRQRLGPERYAILRQAGTERAFSGALYHNKDDGTYACGGCGLPLFSSSHKYESGSGWPSFYQPLDPDRILTRTDEKFGMARTEIVCAGCEGHLGHVFPDGPRPTGERYCVNSLSLAFERADDTPGD